jgi:predicted dehydrogenase
MKRVRAAVVGVGHLGRFHAEKYAAEPSVDLVAVVDTDESRARDVARALGTEAGTDFRDLFGRVDCASVAVPTASHAEVGMALLEAGIDVLVEKPLGSNLEEARALVEAAERRGRVLQVGHLERFNPAIRTLRGLLTHPRFIECHRLAPFVDRGTDVDVVLDLMIHDLDVILSIVPAEVVAIEAVGVPVLTSRTDIANARLRFSNGAIANVTASRVSLKRERKLRIFQPDAYLSLDYGAKQMRLVRRTLSSGGLPGIEAEEIPVPFEDALETEIRAFLESVRTRALPPVSGREGLRAMELAEQIHERIDAELDGARGR